MRNVTTKHTELKLYTVPTPTDITTMSTGHATSSVKVSVVVPAKNEARNLPHVLPRIPDWVYEVILVDGNSTDDTVAVAQKLLPDKLRCIKQTGKGKGNALRAGFNAAQGNIIVMIDADGSMAPEEIPLYVGALLAGADFVKGSRFLQGGGTDDMEWLRFMGNWGLTQVVRLLFGSAYSDLCYGYSAFWARVLPKLDLKSDGFEIETEMNVRALKANLKVVEVPSFEASRVHGVSNLNTFRDGWRVLMQIMSEYVEGMRQSREKVPASSHTAEYIKAMSLLKREAQHLSVIQNRMSPQSYRLAFDALQEANRTIQTMMIENPAV